MLRIDLVRYLDGYLQTYDMQDRSNNGLQVEGAAEVTRLGVRRRRRADEHRRRRRDGCADADRPPRPVLEPAA